MPETIIYILATIGILALVTGGGYLVYLFVDFFRDMRKLIVEVKAIMNRDDILFAKQKEAAKTAEIKIERPIATCAFCGRIVRSDDAGVGLSWHNEPYHIACAKREESDVDNAVAESIFDEKKRVDDELQNFSLGEPGIDEDPLTKVRDLAQRRAELEEQRP